MFLESLNSKHDDIRNQEPSLQSLALSMDRLDLNREILTCEASKSFFQGVSYTVAYLYQTNKICFPNNPLFTFSDQYHHRFKPFVNLSNLEFQDFESYSQFWQNNLNVSTLKR